jgi:hypothetical protein
MRYARKGYLILGDAEMLLRYVFTMAKSHLILNMIRNLQKLRGVSSFVLVELLTSDFLCLLSLSFIEATEVTEVL